MEARPSRVIASALLPSWYNHCHVNAHLADVRQRSLSAEGNLVLAEQKRQRHDPLREVAVLRIQAVIVIAPERVASQ